MDNKVGHTIVEVQPHSSSQESCASTVQKKSEPEICEDELKRNGKKRRTVTFAELDASKLDKDGNGTVLYTIIPPPKYEDYEGQKDYSTFCERHRSIIFLFKILTVLFVFVFSVFFLVYFASAGYPEQ